MSNFFTLIQIFVLNTYLINNLPNIQQHKLYIHLDNSYISFQFVYMFAHILLPVN